MVRNSVIFLPKSQKQSCSVVGRYTTDLLDATVGSGKAAINDFVDESVSQVPDLLSCEQQWIGDTRGWSWPEESAICDLLEMKMVQQQKHLSFVFKERRNSLEFYVLCLARVLSEVGFHIVFVGKNVGHIAARVRK